MTQSPTRARVSSGKASLAAPVLSPAPAIEPASSLSTVRLRGVGGFVLRMGVRASGLGGRKVIVLPKPQRNGTLGSFGRDWTFHAAQAGPCKSL